MIKFQPHNITPALIFLIMLTPDSFLGSSRSGGADEREWEKIAASFRKLNVELDQNNREMLYCAVKPSTGDSDIDESICLLIERCVQAGFRKRKDVRDCVQPYLIKLQGLVRAGAFAALEQGNSRSASRASQPSDSNDIVVEGRRSIQPRAGLWQFRSTQIFNDDGFGGVSGFTRPRYWQRCIADESVETALSLMMRPDSHEDDQSPCKWKITPNGNQIRGKLYCIARMPSASLSVVRGELEGHYSANRYAVTVNTAISLPAIGKTSHSEDQVVGRRVRDCTESNDSQAQYFEK